MHFSEINWNALWLESRKKRSWQTKKSAVWDRRAASFARRNMTSAYVDRLLDIIAPRQELTVLDIGCGPGTLAIPLAKKVQKVTAVDFSAKMLAILEENAARQGLRNITPVLAAWEDDWHRVDIPRHDVVIASRSLSVDNLEAALTKIAAWAKKSVFIADRVGAGPFDADLFKAIGRKFEPGPDYIFTINILYQMGIHASVQYITLQQPKYFTSPQEAVDSCAWMFENLTDSERAVLDNHVQERLCETADGEWGLTKKEPTKWAVISWEVE